MDVVERRGLVPFGVSVVMVVLMTSAGAEIVRTAPEDVRLRGYVGARLDGCIARQVEGTDVESLVDVFRCKTETALWQAEFWGKWMLSSVPLVRYSERAGLSEKIASSVDALLRTQLPDGYLGNYSPKARCGDRWDVWGMKYTMHGLLVEHDRTGNRKALEAAARLCDYLVRQFGEGGKQLRKSGCFCGLPSCSILEPVVELYRRTKDAGYLSFAKQVVREMNEFEDGPKLIDDALADVAVARRFPNAKPWGNGLNPGLKAYEMMSCYQGLVEYGLVTGDQRCIEAAAKTARNIIETEINVCGGASSSEHWYEGAKNQIRPFRRQQETCVTITWMRLCARLLEVTGDPSFADELEKTFYNAYLAALSRENDFFASYTPLSGFRSRGQYHCKMHTNCCNANGSRGFVTWLQTAVEADGNAVSFNLYGSSTTTLKVPSLDRKVTFETFTRYPADGRVDICYRTEAAENFVLRLRIPGWCRHATACINEQPVSPVVSGGYLELDRMWKQGDVISLEFDLDVVAHVCGEHVAFTRGPVVLVRDRRLSDDDIGEVVRLADDGTAIKDGSRRPGRPVRSDRTDVWMTCSLELPMGAHGENPENALPQDIVFCDFASAGNTWTSESAYRVWLPLECIYRMK